MRPHSPEASATTLIKMMVIQIATYYFLLWYLLIINNSLASQCRRVPLVDCPCIRVAISGRGRCFANYRYSWKTKVTRIASHCLSHYLLFLINFFIILNNSLASQCMVCHCLVVRVFVWQSRKSLDVHCNSTLWHSALDLLDHVTLHL